MASPAAHVVVIVATLAALGSCVLLQYEGLLLIWRRLSAHTGHRRVKVLYGIFSVFFLHVAQIWLFGAVLWLLLMWPACGSLVGMPSTGFVDCIYFSAITFSTVGFGDLAPVGPVRFLAGTEALSGLVLITWSASFMYLEMERFWRHPAMGEKKAK